MGIKSFKDLDVYNESYSSMLFVFKEVLPLLPKEERYDLTDQIRRSSKAIPRLIAEGYAKRHQNKGFQKYLDDAMAESNETLVSLEQARDIYNINVDNFDELIAKYDKIGRQLYRLREAWHNFKK